MRIVVTGGTGFIGSHVVNELIKQGFSVIVTGTNIQKARTLPWFEKVEFIDFDINKDSSGKVLMNVSPKDKLLHLVWPGLPNYKSLFHFEDNLVPQYTFIKDVVNFGLTDITITGTCFEYGMRNGMLSEDLEARADNPYALAKDTLHKFLIELQKTTSFQLKWARLFYMYGRGQSPSSILSQLDKAIQEGANHFNMSKGEQVRDYLRVEDVASKLIKIVCHETFNGTINCCSGAGIRIKDLVERYLGEKNYHLELNLGYYPYNDYEAFEFWGDNSKWNSIFA